MDVLRNDIAAALGARAVKARRTRFQMRSGADAHDIRELRDDGFTLTADEPPLVRGHVDIFEADDRIARGLIYCTGSEGGVVTYAFKRNTADLPPAPVDWARPDDAPVALIARD